MPEVQTMQESARDSIRVVAAACRQVHESTNLRQLLKIVLATGNLLNAGTNRGNAQGVKLDTLLKLADVKVCILLYMANSQILLHSPYLPLCISIHYLMTQSSS